MSHTTPKVIPTLRYDDAPAAIDWLSKAFGFERHMVVEGEGKTIGHAQLSFPGGMIMLGSSSDDDFGKFQKPPKTTGGVCTQSAYIIVDDIDAHYARAKAAGADIRFELEEKVYGGKGYGCVDPEGHVWSFGDYDPFADAG